jgi:hypothetical protein
MESLQPQTTARVLDRTVEIFRNSFLFFAGMCLPAGIGALALGVLLNALNIGRWTNNPIVRIGFALLHIVVYVTACGLASGATALAISTGRPARSMSIAGSYLKLLTHVRRVLGILGLVAFKMMAIAFATFVLPLLAVGLLATKTTLFRDGSDSGLLAAVGFAFLLAIISGIIWMLHVYARASFAVPCCVLENTGIRNSLRRSRTLTKPGVRRVWAAFLCSGLLYLTLKGVTGIPLWVDRGLWNYHHQIASAVDLLCAFVAVLVSSPITVIATVLLYYDQRIRKEAFDLEILMADVESGLPQASVPVSANSPDLA